MRNTSVTQKLTSAAPTWLYHPYSPIHRLYSCASSGRELPPPQRLGRIDEQVLRRPVRPPGRPHAHPPLGEVRGQRPDDHHEQGEQGPVQDRHNRVPDVVPGGLIHVVVRPAQRV